MDASNEEAAAASGMQLLGSKRSSGAEPGGIRCTDSFQVCVDAHSHAPTSKLDVQRNSDHARTSLSKTRKRIVAITVVLAFIALVLSTGFAFLVADGAEGKVEAERQGSERRLSVAPERSRLDDNNSESAFACRTVHEGELCHAAVTWAMQDGVLSNPDWYEPLDASSTFEEFQALLHQGRHEAGCPAPCESASSSQAKVLELPPPVPVLEYHTMQEPISRRRRWKDMTSCRRRHPWYGSHDLPTGWRCTGKRVETAPNHRSLAALPDQPYLSHYNGSNPLQIAADPKRSKNYFLLLGDWGRHDSPGPCQMEVARKLKMYVSKQKASGKTLLAVGLAGDNFYWTGATPGSWDRQWEPAYETRNPNSVLHKIPWIATLGNHDYGDNDPYAFCPHHSPRGEIGSQAYSSHQLNRDRNPTRPEGTEHYWFPDYNFHYEIPEASLEFISLDTNYANVVNNLGPDSEGFREAFRKCYGREHVAAFMKRVSEAGVRLLRERARNGTANTTVILQHYPGSCQKDVFETTAREAGRTTRVLCAYGHVHDQKCEGWEHGSCNMVLTGGGGGCCGNHRAGFTAVHLTEDGGFTTDLESDDVSLPASRCHMYRRM